jgi:ribose transport system permease protein
MHRPEISQSRSISLATWFENMPAPSTTLKKPNYGEQIRAFAPLLVLVGLVLVIGTLRPGFFNLESLIVTVADTAILFILGAGSTFVVMLGSIDLSIQAICSFASVIVALMLPTYGYGFLVAALVMGLLAGVVSGIFHVWLKIPSFIVTLATSGLLVSAALLMSHERAISIEESGRAYLTWVNGRLLGLPNVIWIAGLVAALGIWCQKYTPFGRYSIAIGAGEPATWASGVKVNRYKVLAFATSGALAALAGILMAGRQGSGSPNLADQLLLPAIASVIVGGTAITGGAGGIGRTAVGALIITIVRVGMTFIGVNIFAQQIVFGLVLILAVALTIDRSKIVIVK